MIDLHTHVLPGIDDGSTDMDMSMEMLFIAAESGVETLVTTPHCNIPGEFDNYADKEMELLWNGLEQERERAGIPIRLCRGMEIFATPDLPELLSEERVWTLNGTNYFLTEFAFDEDPEYCWRILEECESQGFRPIIAHPERYFFLQDDLQIAYEWCTAGYGLQLNKGSPLGRFGPEVQQTAIELLNHGLIACVASDAHYPHRRSTYMGEIRRFLEETYGEDCLYLLLEENPARILRGDTLLGVEPIPFL